jgi:hypothetical protein
MKLRGIGKSNFLPEAIESITLLPALFLLTHLCQPLHKARKQELLKQET